MRHHVNHGGVTQKQLGDAHLARLGDDRFGDDPPRAFADRLALEVARFQKDDPVAEVEAHDVAELRLRGKRVRRLARQNRGWNAHVVL